MTRQIFSRLEGTPRHGSDPYHDTCHTAHTILALRRGTKLHKMDVVCANIDVECILLRRCACGCDGHKEEVT